MKKYIYISFALVIFLFAATEKSFACSCAVSSDPPKKQIENALINSDAVFSGEVVEIKESPTEKYNLTVKFKIAKSWKGASGREITINTAKDSAMCGYNFEVGKKYLVYANGSKQKFSTSNCSRTAILGKDSDAQHLDKLKQKKTKSA